MQTQLTFLAFDLGAESGRAVAGTLNEGKLSLREVHRFPNGPVRVGESLHWDVLRQWAEIQQGLGMAVGEFGAGLLSVGVDTWGVDYGLLDSADRLLGAPYHYRDARNNGMMEKAFQRIPREEIYNCTGIQFMQLNSLYQLYSEVLAGSPMLEIAQTFLTMPDLFHFWLTGVKANEFTNATTTQAYNPRRRDWAWEVIERLGIPRRIFGQVVQPGTQLGTLLPWVADSAGCERLPVILPATHDTGSAVAGVPADGEDFMYISSGTWSLMGVENREALITQQTLAYDFTNEGGLDGTYRFLKNIMGLWLVQECRREWSRGGTLLSYDELTRMAAEAPAFGPIVAVADGRFFAAGAMSPRIQAYCRETGQTVPQSRGEIIRCALESLALEYRWVAERLEDVNQKRLGVIHIIGGGSRNVLLNQLTADCTGRHVVAGPVEATAIGNLLAQMLGMGVIGSVREGREIVRRSFDVTEFTPHPDDRWDAAYEKYTRLRKLAVG